MTINTPMDNYITLVGATDVGGTLSWTGTNVQSVGSPTTFGVRDINEDGNLDIGQDH